jgi:transcriptional regulator with XRE-family HTH domain
LKFFEIRIFISTMKSRRKWPLSLIRGRKAVPRAVPDHIREETERLRSLLERQVQGSGLSLEDLASRLGSSLQSVSKTLTQTGTPLHVPQILAILREIDVPPEAFYSALYASTEDSLAVARGLERVTKLAERFVEEGFFTRAELRARL